MAKKINYGKNSLNKKMSENGIEYDDEVPSTGSPADIKRYLKKKEEEEQQKKIKDEIYRLRKENKRLKELQSAKTKNKKTDKVMPSRNTEPKVNIEYDVLQTSSLEKGGGVILRKKDPSGACSKKNIGKTKIKIVPSILERKKTSKKLTQKEIDEKKKRKFEEKNRKRLIKLRAKRESENRHLKDDEENDSSYSKIKYTLTVNNQSPVIASNASDLQKCAESVLEFLKEGKRQPDPVVIDLIIKNVKNLYLQIPTVMQELKTILENKAGFGKLAHNLDVLLKELVLNDILNR